MELLNFNNQNEHKAPLPLNTCYMVLCGAILLIRMHLLPCMWLKRKSITLTICTSICSAFRLRILSRHSEYVLFTAGQEKNNWRCILMPICWQYYVVFAVTRTTSKYILLLWLSSIFVQKHMFVDKNKDTFTNRPFSISKNVPYFSYYYGKQTIGLIVSFSLNLRYKRGHIHILDGWQLCWKTLNIPFYP